MSLGADAVINYRTTPDWDRAARDLTGGAGVDHVLEVGGAGTLPFSLKAVRRGGHIALIGVLAGGGEIDPRFIFVKQAKIQGIYVGSRQMFEEMNRAIGASGMRPVIDRVFGFADIPRRVRIPGERRAFRQGLHSCLIPPARCETRQTPVT